MTERRWKKIERSICSYLGMERVPVTGRARGHAPDGRNDRLAAEIKSKNTLPAWLLDAVNQAEAGARDGQLPITVLHQRGMAPAAALVVLRARDFVGWFGEAA